MNICIKCRVEKDLSSFRKRTDRLNKYRTSCKECERKYHKSRSYKYKYSNWLYKKTKDNGLYKKYLLMTYRCNNKNTKYYYQKGIKVEWKSYQDFKDDMYESYIKHLNIYGHKQTTIDRLDSDKNYCKANCRWATYVQQIESIKINKIKNLI